MPANQPHAYGSKSLSILDKSVLLGNTRIVECTATQANKLLRDAKRDWPDAVSRILEGIRAVGSIRKTTDVAIRRETPADQIRLNKTFAAKWWKGRWAMTKHTNATLALFSLFSAGTFGFKPCPFLTEAITLVGVGID